MITNKNQIQVQLRCIGTPTYFRISEDPSFSGTIWQKFTNSRLKVTIDLPTVKEYLFYIQVKSSVMFSNTVELNVVKINTSVPILLKVIILEKIITEDGPVVVKCILQYNGTPVAYKVAITETEPAIPNWQDIQWENYENLQDTLDIEIGQSTIWVHFLLKDDAGIITEKKQILELI